MMFELKKQFIRDQNVKAFCVFFSLKIEVEPFTTFCSRHKVLLGCKMLICLCNENKTLMPLVEKKNCLNEIL